MDVTPQEVDRYRCKISSCPESGDSGEDAHLAEREESFEDEVTSRVVDSSVEDFAADLFEVLCISEIVNGSTDPLVSFDEPLVLGIEGGWIPIERD
jgi:hypothetical protein